MAYQSHHTLNSNLILLILKPKANAKPVTVGFKFQSDSINTSVRHAALTMPTSFKFQSDSINTSSSSPWKSNFEETLNSNLILLILLP